MSLIRRSWRPALDEKAGLHDVRARRTRERASARALQGSLISLAGLVGSPVRDASGKPVGKLRDVVVHWTRAAVHPHATAIVIRSGGRDALVGMRWVDIEAPAPVRLRSSAVYARTLERRPADVALAYDVLDRQVVDTNGMQLVRPADVYLVDIDGLIEVAGIEVGVGARLRRIGPRRLRARARPQRVIDWATIRAFAPARSDGVGRGRRHELAGQAGAGLQLAVSAAEVRRLRPSEVEDALEAANRSHRGSS